MKRFGIAVLLVAVGAISVIASDFQLFKFTIVLVYAIALLGLNILTGYNGQISLGHEQWTFLLTLTVLVFLFVIASNLLGGRIGRAAMAMRDHPAAAEAMGINATFYKSLIFGISAMYTGIAGGLSGVALWYVAPASLTCAGEA